MTKQLLVVSLSLACVLYLGCADGDEANPAGGEDTRTGLNSSSDSVDPDSPTAAQGTDTPTTTRGTDTVSAAKDTADTDSPTTQNGTDQPVACSWNGIRYDAGTTFSSIPGTNCNDCSCLSDGTVGCADTECVPVQGCLYNGTVYGEGDSFPAADGCNTCSCSNGMAACTEMACVSECSTPNMKKFEPGCGGSPNMPVIEMGCYQQCAGQSCDNGICQMTDVNPCVCPKGGDCCEACGASEWLCLDAPEKCAGANPQFYIAGAGKRFGECLGECSFMLKTNLNEGTCATITLEVTGTDGTIRTNLGELTPEGTALLSGLAAELSGKSLSETYGCPDCQDGGSGHLELVLDGQSRNIKFEYQNPPAELAKADKFAMTVLDALDYCETSEFVVAAPGHCTARSR